MVVVVKRVFSSGSAARDSLYVSVGLLLTVVSGIVLTALAARAFSVEEFAALNWALGLVMFLSVLAQVGGIQSSTVIASTSEHSHFFRKALYLLAVVSIAVVVIFFLWCVLAKLDVLERFAIGNKYYKELFFLLVLWLPAAALMPVVAGFFRGSRRFDIAMFFGDYIRRFVIALFALSVILGVSVDLGLSDIIVFAIVIESAVCLFGIYLLGRICDFSLRKEHPKNDTGFNGMFKFTGAFYLPAVVAGIVPQSAVWLLPISTSDLEVSKMAIAIRFSIIFSLPFFVAARVIAPRVAKSLKNGELGGLEPRLRGLASCAFWFGVISLLGFVFFGKGFLALVVGSQYGDAWSVTILLALNKVVSAGFGFCMLIMVSGGDGKHVTRYSLLYLPVYIFGVFFLSRHYGADGAAMGSLIFIFLLNVRAFLFVKNKYQFNTAAFLVPTSLASKL